MQRTGLLLINLGTPSAPTPSAVRSYLRQFLLDPRVLDMAPLRRAALVHLLILPLRSRRSARAYAKIWAERGSPLLANARDLAARVQELLGAPAVVELGMRYGQPSLAAAFERLRVAGCRRIVAFPLYAQYTASATGSSLAELFRVAAGGWDVPYLQVVPPFFDHPAYLEAKAELARPVLERVQPDQVFFSFHGVPERQIRRSDAGRWCLESPDCCARLEDANRHCYRAQCFEHSRRLAELLGVPAEKRVVAFQSRLGRTPWIRPFTDQALAEAVRAGARRGVVISSFVLDCLETLEEIGIRAVESWREMGGEQLELVPAPNASEAFARAVVKIAEATSPWLEAAGP